VRKGFHFGGKDGGAPEETFDPTPEFSIAGEGLKIGLACGGGEGFGDVDLVEKEEGVFVGSKSFF